MLPSRAAWHPGEAQKAFRSPGKPLSGIVFALSRDHRPRYNERPRRLSVVSGTEMPEQSNGAESLFRAQGAGDRSGRRLLIAKVENSAQVGRGRGQSTVNVKAGLNSQNGCVTNRRDRPLDSLD